jgi:type I restriction enzyme, S subunit
LTSNGSWQKVRFDEICKNISDRIDDPKQAETDYYIGLEHLDSEDPKISRHGSPQDVSKTKLLFKSGHILFGKRNWYLRRLAVAQRDGICSAHMLVLEPIEGKSTKEFLPLLMFSDEFYEKALMVSAGSMSPTIKWKDISKLEFLIPSIEQQEKILLITDKIDHTISNAQTLLEKTKNYMVSRCESLLSKGIGHTKFKKVKWGYGKEIMIPEEWEIKSINELGNVVRGGSPRPAGDPKFFGGIIPWITVGEITKDNQMYLKSTSNTLTDEGKRESRYLESGTVVISNSGATLGVPKILSISGCANDGVAAILDLKEIIPEFLYYRIFSWTNLLRNINQGTGQPNLNTTIIGNLKIYLPSLSEQQKIISILYDIDKHIIQQQSHLTNLKVLRKSILNSKLTKEKVLDQ